MFQLKTFVTKWNITLTSTMLSWSWTTHLHGGAPPEYSRWTHNDLLTRYVKVSDSNTNRLKTENDHIRLPFFEAAHTQHLKLTLNYQHTCIQRTLNLHSLHNQTTQALLPQTTKQHHASDATRKISRILNVFW